MRDIGVVLNPKDIFRHSDNPKGVITAVLCIYFGYRNLMMNLMISS